MSDLAKDPRPMLILFISLIVGAIAAGVLAVIAIIAIVVRLIIGR